MPPWQYVLGTGESYCVVLEQLLDPEPLAYKLLSAPSHSQAGAGQT